MKSYAIYWNEEISRKGAKMQSPQSGPQLESFFANFASLREILVSFCASGKN